MLVINTGSENDRREVLPPGVDVLHTLDALMLRAKAVASSPCILSTVVPWQHV